MLGSIHNSKIIKWVIFVFIGLIIIGFVSNLIRTYYEQKNRMIINNFKVYVQKEFYKSASYPAFNYCIDSLLISRQYDQAIKLTKIRIENYPEDKPLLVNTIGYIYFEKGDISSAINTYSKAIEICDTLLVAYQNRGWAYLQINKIDLAIKDFIMASKLDIQSLCLLGLALEKKGYYSEAIKSYSTYLKYYPKDDEIRLKMDTLRVKLKK